MKEGIRGMLQMGLPVPRFLRPVIRGLYRTGVFAGEVSHFLYKLLWVEPVLRSLCVQVGKGLRAERLPYIRGRGMIRLGDTVNLSGQSCFYFPAAGEESPEIVIGNRVFIGNGCTLSAARRISIGDDCLISSCVRIHDNDGHPLDAERRRRREAVNPEEIAPVVIGDNVWIGASAIILKGVTIGRNSVIGAGAVVTGEVPPDSVVAGNPARVVKSM